MLKLLLLLIICVSINQVLAATNVPTLDNSIGFYFLGPDLYSYDQVFGYYYLVKSTKYNYFDRNSIGGMAYGWPSPTIRKIYKQAGASNFKASYNSVNLADGYSLIMVTDMPNDAILYLIINGDSRGLNTSTNTYGEPIIKCLTKSANVYNCLSEDQQVMIDNIITNTNIVLPKVKYMSNGEFAGILVGSLLVLGTIIVTLCCCTGRCKRKHHEYDDYEVFTIIMLLIILHIIIILV